MKIMLISRDKELFNSLLKLQKEISLPVELFSGAEDPLDILSEICSENASLVILDDDFIKPGSAVLLKAIRKVKESLDIIFLTSNDSIELGKEITSLSVQFYAIKPISSKELMQSINSIIKYKSKQIN
ncbi:MAG: response regulator [Calditrichaeota bacterium]|nr:MAG: response regulator [Calditrichota bacterium]MBL1206245.1 response regulator [Calditrichota bacterium]